MRSTVAAFLCALAAGASGYALGCGSSTASNAPNGSNGTDGGTTSGDDGGTVASCTPCASDSDCNGGVCAELGNASYCATTCPNGNECSSDTSCEPANSVTGAQTSVCIPRVACGGGGASDAGTHNDAGVPFDGGSGAPTGTVTASGGKLSRLLFSVVGDTRPPTPDDVGGYPTPIITKIFSDIEALPARPAFVVSTGDYQFASSGSSSTASAQFDIYLAARAKYSGVEFPAMGNHECTGGTTSNCGAGNANGITANYSAYLSKLLAPIHQTKPYYAIRVDAIDGSWTSKLVFVAANAWDSGQSSWLTSELATPTTYTFVIRHESSTASPQPAGVAASDAIIQQHPYTLLIVGHSHTYYHGNGAREVTIGNGGAPLSSKNYGFGVVSQRSDGAISVDMIDYSTGLADARFHFVVKPDGSPTQ
jgi:hypothetical protein